MCTRRPHNVQTTRDSDTRARFVDPPVSSLALIILSGFRCRKVVTKLLRPGPVGGLFRHKTPPSSRFVLFPFQFPANITHRMSSRYTPGARFLSEDDPPLLPLRERREVRKGKGMADTSCWHGMAWRNCTGWGHSQCSTILAGQRYGKRSEGEGERQAKG